MELRSLKQKTPTQRAHVAASNQLLFFLFEWESRFPNVCKATQMCSQGLEQQS